MKKKLIWLAGLILLGVAIGGFFRSDLPAPTYTYVVRELAQTFTQTMTFASNIVLSTADATVDGKNLDLVPANAKIVNICDSGCEYTDLGTACASETSTATNPIVYYIHAGKYTTAAGYSCSGEDYATIKGDGIGSTIITVTNDTFTDYGAIMPGTSSNMTIKDMSLNGHRGVWIDGQGANLGKMRFENLDILASGVSGNEDCIFVAGLGSGSSLYYVNNVCAEGADGFTIGDGQTGVGCATTGTAIYSSGNQFRYNTPTVGIIAMGWSVRCPVCSFQSTGDTVRMVGDGPNSGHAIYGFSFDESAIGGCSAAYRNDIVAPNIYVKNTASNGQTGEAQGIRINMTSATGTTTITGGNVYAETTDATTGTAYALRAVGAGVSVVNVVGGKYQQVGGTQLFDLSDNNNGDVRVTPGTQYSTQANITVSSLPSLAVTGSTTFTGSNAGPVYSDADTSIGYTLSNSDASNNEGSAYLKFVSSAASAETYYIEEDSSGALLFMDGSFNQRLKISQAGLATFNGGNLLVTTQHGEIQIGGNNASDFTALKWDVGTTDSQLTWNDTSNRMDWSGVETLRMTAMPLANPTLNTAGDWSMDSTANQMLYYSGGAIQVLDPVRNACMTSRGIAATDDNFVFWVANQAVSVLTAGCRCVGTCSTVPTFTFEDNDGNAISLDSSPLSCTTGTTETAFSTFTTADADRSMVAGEGIAFDTTNTPVAATDFITVCITYTVDRQ